MSSPSPSTSPAWLREISGGLIAGAVAVVYAVSYAALLFPGSLRHLLPIGIGLCLVNAAVGAFWLAWRSQLPFAIAGPDGNTTSIMAAMAATLMLSGVTAVTPEQVVLMLAITSLLCALLFLALGVGRLGSAVRYVPYPVIGGFLASTGWLIATGALRVAADLPASVDSLDKLRLAAANPQLLATVALGIVFMLLFRRQRHPAWMPAVLLASGLAVHALLAAAGVGVEQARAEGWLFAKGQSAHWVAPWQLLDSLAGYDWRWIAGQWLDMLAVAAVAVITVLLGASGLEVMSRGDISLDRELRTHGWLNLAAPLLGGYLSLVSVGRSAVLLDTGTRTRAAGMVAAAVCAAAMGGATLALGWVPKPVLAGFLLSLGLSILWEWVVQARARLGRADWALILVILATTATIGFTVAVLAGIIASCLNFALSYSRVGVVQHDLDGRAIHSSVVRPAAHRQLLDSKGADIRVLVLRGVIFFGTASTLLERLRSFLEQPAAGPQRVLVLDFSHVASADSSAGMTFTKIAQLAALGNVRLQVCGLNAATRPAAGQAALSSSAIHPNLDSALDAAEEILLASHGQDPAEAAEPMHLWLPRELGGPQHWALLEPLLQRREVPAGQVLMRQGEPSNATLYLIETGRLAITLSGQGHGRRLASLMAGNIVGEMALYSSADRSATATAERASVVWSLTRDALESLHVTAPDTALRVHALVMRTMAERVRQANTTIAALQRGA
jgi:SulP family sulfate permease